MPPPLLQNLALALGLGLLVGLERQRAVDDVAGLRTFPIMTLLGYFAVTVGLRVGGSVVAAALVGLAALIVAANVARSRMGDTGTGITTEAAALVMFTVGGALALELVVPSVVATGALAVLLHFRDPLHDLADRIHPGEFDALIRLVIIALVVLPLLPDRAYGPFGVLNPFQVWLMVVLIVGISLGAYVAYRLLGHRGGTLLAGVLGGLISSTATAVSYARRTSDAPDRVPAAAVVVMLASTVVFARVLFEIGVVAPGALGAMAPPILIMAAVMVGIAGVLYLPVARTPDTELEEQEPPSELGPAIVFGLLYAGILLAVAAAREHLGSGALYGVAAISGLTDVDAITLSTARLVHQDDLDATTGWRLVLVGTMANLCFKAGAVVVLGHRRLGLRVLAATGAALVAGGLIIFFWPGAVG